MPVWALTFLRVAWPYLLAAVAAFGVAAYLRHQGAQAEREAAFRREVEAYKADTVKANQIAVGLEAELATARTKINQLNERLQDELHKDPVYGICRVPAGGVRVADRALTGNTTR